MDLPPLYHWSPADRYGSIRERGLVAGSKATVASAELPMVCAGTDPRSAWSLSAAMDWASEIDEWDLWLIHLGQHDEARVRTDYGPRIIEVKIHNTIPPERLWYVGRRDRQPSAS